MKWILELYSEVRTRGFGVSRFFNINIGYIENRVVKYQRKILKAKEKILKSILIISGV